MKITSSSAELYEVGYIHKFIVFAEFQDGIGILSLYNHEVKAFENFAHLIHHIVSSVVLHLSVKL